MAVTAHFLENKYKMQEITLGIPHTIVRVVILFDFFTIIDAYCINLFTFKLGLGSHSGESFAKLFRKTLDQFDCSRKLFRIKADNNSTKNKMAEWIEK